MTQSVGVPSTTQTTSDNCSKFISFLIVIDFDLADWLYLGEITKTFSTYSVDEEDLIAFYIQKNGKRPALNRTKGGN